jgi:soluble lytic murein transglycosylase
MMIMTSKHLVLGGLLALVAVAPELINRRATNATGASVEEQAVPPGEIQQTDRERGVALARRGNSLQADEKYQAAILAFDSAAANLPQIRDWLNVFAANSSSFLGDTAEVARRLANVDSLVVRDWAWRMRARAFAEAEARGRALEIATSATARGNAPKRAAAWYVVSELQRDLKNPAAQRAALLRAIDAAAVAEGASDAARVLVEFKNVTPDEYLRAGRSLLRNGEPRLGVAALREYMKSTNDTNVLDNIRYEIGRALFNIGEYRSAEHELDRVSAQHRRAPEAHFLAARAEYRQGKVKEGLASFRFVAAQHAGSVAATRALFSLGDLAQDDRRMTDAVRYFQQAAARYKIGGDEPAQALMRLGGIQFVQKQYSQAESTFETYRERYPRGVAYEQATYWAAQAASAAGKKDAARAKLEEIHARQSFSFYDMRAAQLLDKDILGKLPSGPAVDTTLHAKLDSALERWALLREIGWYEAAAFEMARLRQDVGDNTSALYTLAEALNARDHAYAGIAIGRELLNDGADWDTRLLRIMFPLPYHSIIKREAAARGLDPYFVAALMRQESRFNPRAVSGAGAVGLMQVMPATGRQLGRASRDDLMNPEINIRLGTQFLADMVKTYDARIDAVLAAYNAGPSRMNRWRSFPEFALPDLFVERIPFDETRDYVKVVRVNTSIYHALYGE